jgi:hypothetical protein
MKVNMYWKVDVYKFERFPDLLIYAEIGSLNLPWKIKYLEPESTSLLRNNTSWKFSMPPAVHMCKLFN